jgi:hypothetical protein
MTLPRDPHAMRDAIVRWLQNQASFIGTETEYGKVLSEGLRSAAFVIENAAIAAWNRRAPPLDLTSEAMNEKLLIALQNCVDYWPSALNDDLQERTYVEARDLLASIRESQA